MNRECWCFTIYPNIGERAAPFKERKPPWLGVDPWEPKKATEPIEERKPFRPGEGHPPLKPRHIFQESAAFFVAGVMWQLDIWSIRRRLPWGIKYAFASLARIADDLRMRLADNPLRD